LGKNPKKKEDDKKIEEALKQQSKEEKRRELIEQLNIRPAKKYHVLIQEQKQNSARNINSQHEDN